MAEAAQTTDIMVEVKRRQAMLDKLKQDESALAAKVAAQTGAITVIASGREPNVLTRLMSGEKMGTCLTPA